MRNPALYGLVSPWARRNLIEPMYYGRARSPRLARCRELERTQYLPTAELAARQIERLTELVQRTYAQNDFYRARFDAVGLHPATMKLPEDFTRLPVLTKADVRAAGQSMLSRNADPKRLFQFKTGGSTGTPLKLYATEHCSELRNAAARRSDRWCGWEPGEPIGAVWGNPERPRNLREFTRDLLLSPTVYLDTMHLDDSAVEEFAREWRASGATMLFGHAHSLYLLACYCERLSIDGIKPRGIISSSMMLMPHERATIERVMRTKVTDRYGCEEVSLIACQCERHDGMHLNIDHLFIELLGPQGQTVAPGQPGSVVVTDLINHAMPFLRYRVEDVAVASNRVCACGRGLPLLESVTGRVADFLVLHDGARVAGVSLIENTLTRIPGIGQMQIVQESRDKLTLRLVRSDSFTASTEAQLSEYFADLFRATVAIEFVSAIPPEPSGKYRFSICRIPGDGPVVRPVT